MGTIKIQGLSSYALFLTSSKPKDAQQERISDCKGREVALYKKETEPGVVVYICFSRYLGG